MGPPVNTPGSRLGTILEWRASQIADPVERLRFLQNAERTRPRAPFYRRFVGRGAGRVAGSVLIWMSLLAPSYTPSRARSSISVHGAAAGDAAVAPVWPVEKKPEYELYSNGLRI